MPQSPEAPVLGEIMLTHGLRSENIQRGLQRQTLLEATRKHRGFDISGWPGKDIDQEYALVLWGHDEELLTPLERNLINTIILRSGPKTNKHEGAVQALDQLPGRPKLPIIHLPPEVVEEIYNHSKYLNGSGPIAAIKSFVDLNLYADGALLTDRDRASATLRYLNSTQASFAEETPAQRAQTIGRYNLIVASDIIAKEYDANGEEVNIIHKPNLSTKAEIYQYLRGTVGYGRDDDSPNIYRGYVGALSSYEPTEDIGAYLEREMKTTQLKASDDFLKALLWGTRSEECQDISPTVREQFERKYEEYKFYCDQKGLQSYPELRGWSPETGLPLNLLTRINGAWPDDSLFIMSFLVKEIDGVSLGQQGFHDKKREFQKLALGYPPNLNLLLRHHLAILVEEYRKNERRGGQANPDHLVFSRDIVQPDLDFQEIALSLNSYYRALCEQENQGTPPEDLRIPRLLAGKWYDLSQKVNEKEQPSPGYWGALHTALLGLQAIFVS